MTDPENEEGNQSPPREDSVSVVRKHYVELLKTCLTREGYPEFWRSLTPPPGILGLANGAIQKALGPRHLELVRKTRPEMGGMLAHPAAETMIGFAGLENIEACVTSVVSEGVPGDLIETGVWRGGSTIFMRALLDVFGDEERTVWVADSFQGLPRPDEMQYPEDSGDTHHLNEGLSISVEEVKRNFNRYGLLDDRVRFLEGWFRDTLPAAPIDRLAVLRMDGDMYESTMDALRNLYPKLSVGGYAIVDDFHLPGARKATEDYRAQNGIRDQIVPVDGAIVFWRRSEGGQ